MALYGAFTNSMQALMTQSHAMSLIGQNVANVNTTGYKKVEDQFKTQLSESTHLGTTAESNSYGYTNIFGVKPATRQMVDVQGNVLSTGQTYDLAINGQGFFILSDTLEYSSTSQTMFTRAGSFMSIVPDTSAAASFNNSSTSTGNVAYLGSQSGYYVMGWPADPTSGNITTSTSLSGMEALRTDLFTSYGRATSELTIIANVDSRATDTQAISVPVYKSTTSGSNTTYDAHTVTMNWYPGTSENQWYLGFGVPSTSGNITGIGNSTPTAFNSTASLTLTDVTRNADGSVIGVANTIPAQDLAMTWTPVSGNPYQYTLTLGNVTHDNPAGLTGNITTTSGGAPPLTMTFNADGTLSTAMPTTLTVGWGSTATSATYNVSLTAPRLLPPPNSVAVTFNGDGTLPANTTPANVSITWASGNTTSSVAVDYSGMTQFAGNTMVNNISQNGRPLGTLTSQSFDSDGILWGSYSNGLTRAIGQVPLARFVAPNSLGSMSGTMFLQTPEAGEMTIMNLADGAAGNNLASLIPGAVETSNVVLEDEFTRMITTQKAYSFASKVFQTADDMTKTVRDLR
jgi:flagellar hook protein FlgE